LLNIELEHPLKQNLPNFSVFYQKSSHNSDVREGDGERDTKFSLRGTGIGEKKSNLASKNERGGDDHDDNDQ
jgi:hypothetical protein